MRPLVVSGFMATGKSTVGRLVAERAGARAVDLDQRIEAEHGPIAAIFRDRGEAAFRALERAALERALAEPGAAVIAVGGGALLARDSRLHALEQAVVVTLSASLDEVVRRAAGGPERPLLAGDARERAAALLETRAAAYAECHARIATDARAPTDVAAEALAVWQRDALVVAAGERSYTVNVARGAAERARELAGKAPVRLLVTDTNVAPLHAPALRAALALEHAGTLAEVVLEAGEEHKQIGAVERIWDAALASGCDRSGVLLGLGGGVVTDVTGFAAATFMRGLSWVALPTTLLAMVDAAIGGKTAVDRGAAKNAVGAFWQPRGVACDVTFVATEPERGFRSALAEVVKTALVGDPELLDVLERERAAILGRDVNVVTELVRRSARVKARIVSRDERETTGLRAHLNLGHTLGHALEAHAGFGRLTHGEAVSLGLVAALALGERLGVTQRGVRERAVGLLAGFGLPTDLAKEPLAAAAQLVGHDKKRAGAEVRFVLVAEPGRIELFSLPLHEVTRHAETLR